MTTIHTLIEHDLHDHVSIGIMPGGTGNVLAKNLGIPNVGTILGGDRDRTNHYEISCLPAAIRIAQPRRDDEQ